MWKAVWTTLFFRLGFLIRNMEVKGSVEKESLRSMEKKAWLHIPPTPNLAIVGMYETMNKFLKGPSSQVRSAWKWYNW
jgi:hypothetical protein